MKNLILTIFIVFYLVKINAQPSNQLISNLHFSPQEKAYFENSPIKEAILIKTNDFINDSKEYGSYNIEQKYKIARINILYTLFSYHFFPNKSDFQVSDDFSIKDKETINIRMKRDSTLKKLTTTIGSSDERKILKQALHLENKTIKKFRKTENHLLAAEAINLLLNNKEYTYIKDREEIARQFVEEFLQLPPFFSLCFFEGKDLSETILVYYIAKNMAVKSPEYPIGH